MYAPDDYGLSVPATLACTGETRPAPAHAAFWSLWRKAVLASTPRIVPRAQIDPSDPGIKSEFVSLRSVRLGCEHIDPSGPPRAGIVVIHGAGPLTSLAEELEKSESLARNDVAVLLFRLRGFPGSRLDVPSFDADSSPWMAHGLHAALIGAGERSEPVLDWIVPQAVADVAFAIRVMRAKLGAGPPIFVRADSLGAGLAVMAIAQLASSEPVARLAMSLPSLGNWRWRLAHPPAGAAASVHDVVMRSGASPQSALAVLRLVDAAVHAPLVTCPVLCMLAARDDTVPAPAAASVFNALGTSPGLRCRWVVPFGHFEGGLRNARAHAAFHAASAEFLDPSRDPATVLVGGR